jgi:predicted  nucleic acid-binding Zn-ribbon protein
MQTGREISATPSIVCLGCHVGILVFVQSGVVGAPHARVFRCNHCGSQVTRDAKVYIMSAASQSHSEHT